jgi:hypothetical protein
VLLNDPLFVEVAQVLGERMLREEGSLDARLAVAFRLAATRKPTDREISLLSRLYHDQLAAFREQPESAAKYLKSGARAPASDLDPAELAAAAATMSAILNLDATVMVR